MTTKTLYADPHVGGARYIYSPSAVVYEVIIKVTLGKIRSGKSPLLYYIYSETSDNGPSEIGTEDSLQLTRDISRGPKYLLSL